MSLSINRRKFLSSGVAAGSLAVLAGCSAVQTIPTYEGDASNGPVLVFEDAVARPKGGDTFIDDLTGDKLQHFEMIFFVNKSPWGVYSQTMKILEPDKPGAINTAWRVKASFDISTGRELEERYFTTTPRGIFTFDRNRRHRDYNSQQWDGSSMPFAMFWDYVYPNGRPTGIAFHSTTDLTEKYLGIRASGGCIRLSMAESEQIFDMVGRHEGPVPDFVDRDPRGLLAFNGDGSVKMKQGFKVLVVVEENDNIRWEPFVREEIWQRRLDNKKVIALNENYFEILYDAMEAGQN